MISTIKSNSIFVVALIIFSVINIFIYQYEKLSGDAILQLSIAEKYVRGDFRDAVNGFWGPLFSWLLVPFLYFGSSHLVAVNVLSLVMGLLTINGVRMLSYRFEMTEDIRNAVLFSSVPVVLYFTLVQPADLLVSCILLYYLNIVFNNGYPQKMYNGLLSGALGAFAYFAKSYAFPFFISHFLLINIGYYVKSTTKIDKKKVLRNAFAGIAMFALISSVWIIIISSKYDYVTFSTMGGRNFAVLGPEAEGEGLEIGQPMFHKGFFEPPSKTAIIMWEDPSYSQVESWSVFESWSNFKHFLSIIFKNISQGLRIFGSFSAFSIVIITAYILLCVQPFRELISRSDLIYPLLTVFLYTGGYGLFHFEPRYLWIVNILLLLMGGYLLNTLFKGEFFINRNMRKNILIVVFVLSFIVMPVRYVMQKGNDGERMHALAERLKSQYNIRGNVASNKEYVSTNSSWYKTFLMSYFLNTRYYGQAVKDISDKDLENELKKYNIDYYFVWGKYNESSQFLSNFKEVTSGEMQGLKIYSLKEKIEK